MTDSSYNSPARSYGSPARSLKMLDRVYGSPARSYCGDHSSATESEGEETLELLTEIPSSPDQTILDGWLKFRDNKKWRHRWGVMTKLSPAADCLHLQLYRDSKDRYKHGQTKASLSLQHFLGVESGFTLDKESNTIAIICQDVTVVLAFDTRERLIQWQVKISSNLGDDQQFLIQISSCPPKSKISAGPARLHIQDLRFSMTTGVPPRLAGVWELRHLRKYGVIENRFCYEGGSRCGKGEGLFVCFTDQGDDITRCMNLAAEGKLATRKRLLSRNMSVLESPSRRGLLSRLDSRASEYGADQNSFNQHSHDRSSEDNMCWPSNESRLDNSDFGDTASVGDFQDQNLQECTWTPETALERCASCISKLGALSRSSTMANTPGSIGFNPAWTMDNNVSSLNYIPEMNNGHQCCGYMSSQSSSSGGSAGCSSVCGTEYSVPRKVCASMTDKVNKIQSEACAPNRPPKPVHLKPETSTPVKKAPMPLPQQDTMCVCRCTTSDKPRQSYLNNYDTPKIMCTNTKPNKPYTSIQDEYYDTPRNIKSSLEINPYGNYDTPPSPVAVHKKSNVSTPKQTDSLQCTGICPCQRAMNCWSHNNWMTMPPRCRRSNQQTDNQLSNFTNNCQHNGAIYATVDVSKKKKHAEPPLPAPPSSSNYMNLEPAGGVDGGGKQQQQQQPTAAAAHNGRKPTENYMNLEFSESLCYYENAKNVLTKAGLSNACDKCGHQKRCAGGGGGGGGADEKGDYMTMEPVNGRMVETKRNLFPGYLPMCPSANNNNNNNNNSSGNIGNGNGNNNNNKQQDMLKNIMNRGLAEKSASIPSLNEYKSAAAMANGNDWKTVGGVAAADPHRRRSSSADSSRCDDDGPASGVDRSSRGAGCSDHTSSAESMTSQIAKRPADAASAGATSTASTVSDGSVAADDQQTALVHIRRSSSVPCKNNRDSSSSNDSGVSTGSLRYRGADFAEFELPLTTAMSTMRHRRTVAAATAAAAATGAPAGSVECGGRRANAGCVHGSLPRRSKSTDRLKELSFRFQKFAGTMKSSSAGAEVPVCLKKDKGFNVHADGNSVVPFLDSQSTSSYTSDMSDYIETLSLSSHSSSDTTNNENQRCGRPAKTTLKPRSGKEYHQIGFFLDGDLKVKSDIPPVPEKTETPSPRYATAQESNVV
ncbi:uncharacterized protein LOC132929305 isoform X1 [Rhopalosiphum padi]|uniref:uncharacterized protein LOC132929305 isoform X1 n=1 Tax=Rhopalosiphum padi TaxID=40932 RepID=UPI00298D6B6B|nr:uncharacterized protein LOC132929305 isoform X1 [Rhopalosiphum padi]